ncbi:hypothetical protein KSP40_PGU020828 [Platanthera guangdongensis]|uniref:Uncharacterized protein n=1 Tax=Platanthera guangdongensis TaxID=2320717 RepID=A0ABR2M2B1_9ASPA
MSSWWIVWKQTICCRRSYEALSTGEALADAGEARLNYLTVTGNNLECPTASTAEKLISDLLPLANVQLKNKNLMFSRAVSSKGEERMGFLSLLIVASMPVLQLLFVGSLGAFLASGYSNTFTPSARRDMNKYKSSSIYHKVVYALQHWNHILHRHHPRLDSREDLETAFPPRRPHSCKLLRGPSYYIAGNLGNLMLIIIPALCNDEGSPFSSQGTCRVHGTSYVSLSMALGGIFIWTHSYSLMKRDCITYEKLKKERLPELIVSENLAVENLEDQSENCVKSGEDSNCGEDQLLPLTKSTDESTEQIIMEPLLSSGKLNKSLPLCNKIMETIHNLAKELMEPPTIAAVIYSCIKSIDYGVAHCLVQLLFLEEILLEWTSTRVLTKEAKESEDSRQASTRSPRLHIENGGRRLQGFSLIIDGDADVLRQRHSEEMENLYLLPIGILERAIDRERRRASAAVLSRRQREKSKR